MNLKKTVLDLAMGSVALIGVTGAHAVSLNPGDILALDAGVTVYNASGDPTDVASGSWFALDMNGSMTISGYEKVALSQGTTGVVIGQTTAPGASHAGGILPGDTNAISAPWELFGNTGSDFTTVGIAGGIGAGLDFSGWSVTYNGVVSSLGSGAWGAGFTDGVANFAWDGQYGGHYTLDYAATVPIPQGSVGPFGSTLYRLHLEGTVQAVPEASSWGMMLAGLGLVGVAARRRKWAS